MTTKTKRAPIIKVKEYELKNLPAHDYVSSYEKNTNVITNANIIKDCLDKYNSKEKLIELLKTGNKRTLRNIARKFPDNPNKGKSVPPTKTAYINGTFVSCAVFADTHIMTKEETVQFLANKFCPEFFEEQKKLREKKEPVKKTASENPPQYLPVPVKPVKKAEPVKSESPAAVNKAEPVKKSGAVKEAHPVKKSSPKNEMPNILTEQAFKTCYEESGNAEQEIYELLMECKKKEILDAVKKIFGMTPGRGCQKSLEILCRHFAQRIIFRLKTQANKPVKAKQAPTPVKKSEPVKAVKRISFEECIARYSKDKPKRKTIQHSEQLTFKF